MKSAWGPGAIGAAVALIAAAAPSAAWLRFILTKSPNVPYTDEWTWVRLLTAAHESSVPWSLLWQPHNGHHEVVGGLVFLALDRIAGWSVPREQLVCLLLGTCAVPLIFGTLRRVLDWRDALVLTAISSILLCGPLAYETILIGYNVGWQICTLALAFVVWAFTARRLTPLLFIVAMVAGFVATLSSGQGLFIWPAGVILLLARRAPAAAWAAWLAGGALCAAVYLGGPGGVPHGAATFAEALRYCAVFFGVPLGWDGTNLTAVAVEGALLVALFAAGTALLLRSARRDRSAPLIAYGTYALLGGLSTTFARASFGAFQATSPRYTAMSVFLMIAVLGEVYLVARDAGRRGIVVSALASIVAIVMIGHVQDVMRDAVERYTAERVQELRAIAHEDPAAPADAEDPATLLRQLAELRALDDGPVRYR